MRFPDGSVYWKKHLSQLCKFVLNQNEMTLEIVEAGPVWHKDPFIKKDVACPQFNSCRLRQKAKEKKGKRKISQLQKSHPTRKRTLKPDLKRNNFTSSPKIVKKTQVSKIIEVPWRKKSF